jgi:uncharacterized OB-fold protein
VNDVVNLVDPTLLAEGQVAGDGALLRASKCGDCTRTEFPAHTVCPSCASASTEVLLGPAARLVSFTEVLHQPPGAEIDVPYTIVVAGFDADNLAVMGVLDHHVPSEELEVGQPLEVCVVPTRESATYGFRLA